MAGAAMLAASLAGCAGPRTSDVPEPKGLSAETTQTSVFYSTGRSLVEERKVVSASEPYTAILRELLLAAPEENADIAIVQTTADFNSVTLGDDGVLTIDWKPEVLAFEAEDREKVVALASILRTFGNFPEVAEVRFTVSGKTDGEIGGYDVEAFWGRVSLKGQPWKVIRPGVPPSSKEASAAAGG